MAHKLGAPSRLLIGLGAQGDTLTQTDILSENLHVDIEESYLVGAGAGDWTTWNSPAGYFVQVLAQKAEAVHAIPMYTFYQMAQDGAWNLGKLSSASFMAVYWSNARLMFQQIAVSGKPALVNIEPDFWGVTEEANSNPASAYADVQINTDCSSIGNSVAGIAQCLILMARKYAAAGLHRLSAFELGRRHQFGCRQLHERRGRAACRFHRRADARSGRRLLRVGGIVLRRRRLRKILGRDQHEAPELQ